MIRAIRDPDYERRGPFFERFGELDRYALIWFRRHHQKAGDRQNAGEENKKASA